MIKKYFSKITGYLMAAMLFFSAALPANAQWSGACVSEKYDDVATIQGFECLITKLLSSFLTMVGIAGFLMLVVSGIRILLSGGNSQAVEKSKNSITFAVIGLVVALSSFIILNLIAEFTGVQNILQFFIPTSDTKWQ